MIQTEITAAHLEKYFGISQEAREKVKVSPPAKTHLFGVAEDFLDMADRYMSDAKHFREQGDWVKAFGALNYAHAWLDAGARMGLFDVDHDDRLFTVDGK